MYIRLIITLLLALIQLSLKSQDTAYARNVIDKLASAEFYGRGYVNGGDKLAANFIKGELDSLKLMQFGNSYFQKVEFSINSYPGRMLMVIDSDTLSPVNDYVITPFSKGVKGKFPLLHLPVEADTVQELYDSLLQTDFEDKVLVANFPSYELQVRNHFNASAVLVPKSKMFWWLYSDAPLSDVPVFLVTDSLINGKKEIELNVESKYLKNHTTNNVVAYVQGTQYTDSFIVFSAHYDHLGAMGMGNIFRGANDNASGVAMVLDMARYFKANPPKYSVAFMFFAGEEVNLYGSRQYVESPLFPLSQISALINLDMVGSGSEGVGVVNGLNNRKIVNKLQEISYEKKYIDSFNLRGPSCNSDHCSFHKAGVPAIFIYTQGKECKEYHNLRDVPEILPLTKYSELFSLLVDYVEESD